MVGLISIKGAETLVDLLTELYVIDTSINTIKKMKAKQTFIRFILFLKLNWNILYSQRISSFSNEAFLCHILYVSLSQYEIFVRDTKILLNDTKSYQLLFKCCIKYNVLGTIPSVVGIQIMKFKHRGESQDSHENETLSKEMLLEETFLNKGRTNSKAEESSTHEETIAALKNQF